MVIFSSQMIFGSRNTSVVPSPFQLLFLPFFALILLSPRHEHQSIALTIPPPVPVETPYSFLIVGGTGRIGSAVASHLLIRSPAGTNVTLVGRNPTRCREAVTEILSECPEDVAIPDGREQLWASHVSHRQIDFQRDHEELLDIMRECDCVIHVAGPFLGEDPLVLRLATQCGVGSVQGGRCRAYVDVSDPLDYIDSGLSLDEDARVSGLTAVMTAGAFPGMSNVLALEAASALFSLPVVGDGASDGSMDDGVGFKVRDVRFNYFTAGLGGSGDINLFITNMGFGEPMVQADSGRIRPFSELSGSLVGKVDFFLDDLLEEAGPSFASAEEGSSQPLKFGFGNEVVRERVGTQTVFAWPFPEAATVARELGATGDSSAAMGTAPEFWNTMLGILVSLVPRTWWRSIRFSRFLADFSQPLVKLTDTILRLTSPDGVGETHAMRIDVVDENDRAASVVQAHESFRRCVGQSCAEFALDALLHPDPGVSLPEKRYRDANARRRIVEKLSSIPGTMAYTGARIVRSAPPPTELKLALERAKSLESRL